MSIEIVVAVLLVLGGVYWVFGNLGWRVIGSPDGRVTDQTEIRAFPESDNVAARASAAFRSDIQLPAGEPSGFIPNDGFIDKARWTQIADAEARLPGHIAIDRIQSRPGWLLFDPLQVIGEPPVAVGLEASGADGRAVVVHLYPLDQIRDLERNNTYLAQCRRASILARWGERAKERAARRGRPQPPPLPPSAVTPQVLNANAG